MNGWSTALGPYVRTTRDHIGALDKKFVHAKACTPVAPEDSTMTARDHTTNPLRHRIAALFALLALTAAVLGAHAAWPPAEGELPGDTPIPFTNGDDETELVDVR